MLDDERAEHLPGCNLAVRREVLDAIGGFDVLYETAGDDVDLCFRILDAGHEIGFHPGALRVAPTPVDDASVSAPAAGLRPSGGARRRAAPGALHCRPGSSLPRSRLRERPSRRSRVPRSLRRGRVPIDLWRRRRPHRRCASCRRPYRGGAGIRGAALRLPRPCHARVRVRRGLRAAWRSGSSTIADACLVEGTGEIDDTAASVAALWLLQPIARMWGRLRGGGAASDDDGLGSGLRPARTVGRSVVVAGGDRVDVVRAAMRRLRRVGLVAAPASPWADHDAAFDASLAVHARLVSSAYPEGFVQLRVRRRMRPAGFAIACLALAIAVIAPSTCPARCSDLRRGCRHRVLAQRSPRALSVGRMEPGREAAASATRRRSGNDHSYASGRRRLADAALPTRVRAARMRNLLRRSPRTGTADAHAFARGRCTGGGGRVPVVNPRAVRFRRPLGLPRIAYASGVVLGMSEAELRRLYSDAAMIVNLHGGTCPLDEHVRGERLVLVQTDPVQLEVELHDWIPESHAFAGAHAAWFSFAELLGQPGCGLPVPPYPVQPTRQPVLLDLWSTACAPG